MENSELLEKKYWDIKQNRGMCKRQSDHPVTKFFASQRFDYINSKINLEHTKTCLDVGSGTGYGSSNCPPAFKITALDFSNLNLKLNKTNRKIQASVYNLPFRDNSFDLVYGWEFLHHLENPQKAVNEMMRVTTKYLILIEPNRYNIGVFLYAIIEKIERKMLQYNKSKILNLLNNQFRIISCDSIGWIFAGSTPLFLLNLLKHLPFRNIFGVANIVIATKEN